MRWAWGALLLGICMTANGPSVRGQGPASPSATEKVPIPPASREAELEERLRKLEAMNQKILDRYEEMEKRHTARYEKLSREFKSLEGTVKAAPDGPESRNKPSSDGNFWRVQAGQPETGAGPADDAIPEGNEGTIGRGTDGDPGRETGEASTFGGARAGTGEPFGSQSPRGAQGTLSRTRPGDSRTGKFAVGRGLRFTSDDDEFQLIFHDLTQVDFRGFPNNPSQGPLKSQFVIPRQRWYFTGRVTKEVEYYTAVNRGYGTFDLLDAFIDFKYLGPKAALRVGRMKTPSSYEFYQITAGDLIAPERSLYTGNLGSNRQEGMMLHGRVFDERAEYAAGLFNGPRRSFADFDNNKDVFLFFNIRPFQDTDWAILQGLNLGGEWDYGNEKGPLQPSILTTANAQSSASSNATVASLSPTFFAFNSNVSESGPRQHAAAWAVWHYKSLNLLAEYDGGFQDFGLGKSTYRTRVPLSGYFVQAYYFLTGEQIKRRVDITPNREFKFRNGRITGPGAIEVHARYSTLDVGQNVFAAGLSDPNLWTNNAYATDIGANWYPNNYTKIYLDWQHAIFGREVFDGPAAFHKTSDLLWLRFQIFF